MQRGARRIWLAVIAVAALLALPAVARADTIEVPGPFASVKFVPGFPADEEPAPDAALYRAPGATTSNLTVRVGNLARRVEFSDPGVVPLPVLEEPPIEPGDPFVTTGWLSNLIGVCSGTAEQCLGNPTRHTLTYCDFELHAATCASRSSLPLAYIEVTLGDRGNLARVQGPFTNATELYVGGGDGKDRITGSNGGRDTIESGAGADVVRGNGGGDQLYLGTGADQGFGGEGDDFIQARDGTPDYVDCGAGVDTVEADPTDTLIDCENVIPG